MKRSIFRAVEVTIKFSPQSLMIYVCLLLLFIASQIGGAMTVSAQDESIAPPPPRIFTDGEKAQLAAAGGDRRKRLRINIELAENRLARAEQLTLQQQYGAASAELGAYQALIEDGSMFIQEQGTSNNKLRDLLKRFEQSLRAHTLRIEAIRRTTPQAYVVHVEATLKLAKALRAKALDAFFGEGSMRDEASSDSSTDDELQSRVSTTPTPKLNLLSPVTAKSRRFARGR